jgi:broad-specificity NMP kinase
MYYIIIRGPASVGKSLVSELLAKKVNGKHYCIDNILDEHNLTLDREEGYISRRSFLEANKILIPKIKELINKTPVIIDGNFYWKSVLEDLLDKLPYKNKVFTLKANLKTCISRDKNRKPLGKDAVTVVYNKVVQFDYGNIIDTKGKSAEEVVDLIVEKLE